MSDDLKTKQTAYDEAVTELAEEYGQELQRIYDLRIAGDFTFIGVLHEYTMKLDALRARRPQEVVSSRPRSAIKPEVNLRERRRYLR